MPFLAWGGAHVFLGRALGFGFFLFDKTFDGAVGVALLGGWVMALIGFGVLISIFS